MDEAQLEKKAIVLVKSGELAVAREGGQHYMSRLPLLDGW